MYVFWATRHVFRTRRLSAVEKGYNIFVKTFVVLARTRGLVTERERGSRWESNFTLGESEYNRARRSKYRAVGLTTFYHCTCLNRYVHGQGIMDCCRWGRPSKEGYSHWAPNVFSATCDLICRHIFYPSVWVYYILNRGSDGATSPADQWGQPTQWETDEEKCFEGIKNKSIFK